MDPSDQTFGVSSKATGFSARDGRNRDVQSSVDGAYHAFVRNYRNCVQWVTEKIFDEEQAALMATGQVSRIAAFEDPQTRRLAFVEHDGIIFRPFSLRFGDVHSVMSRCCARNCRNPNWARKYQYLGWRRNPLLL